MSDYEFDMSIDLDTDVLFQEEEPEVEEDPTPLPEDQLQSLVCGEDQLFSDSQLAQFVNTPSLDPVLPPAPRSTEVESALQPVLIDWAKDIEEQKAALLESQEDSEVQQGQGGHSLLHTSFETSDQEVSKEWS